MKVIKILALRSNPINTAALRLDEEIRGIKDELERSQYRDRFEFISEGAVWANDCRGEKETAEIPIKKLEVELQKLQPDKSVVDRAVAALEKALDGGLALAEPVAKVTALIAKAWVGGS